MSRVLTLRATASDRPGAASSTSEVTLGSDARAHDRFARLVGIDAALAAARATPGTAIAIPPEALIDLEVTGPEVAHAALVRRGARQRVPAAALCADDDALIALFTLQDQAFRPGASLSLSLSAR